MNQKGRARIARDRVREEIQHQRSGIDRRTIDDRREVYSLDYFLDGGMERRSFVERRGNLERRAGWVRVSRWASMLLDENAPSWPDVVDLSETSALPDWLECVDQIRGAGD